MVKKIVPRQTPEIDALEHGTTTELGAAGLQTPDMDEIFRLDLEKPGRRTPDSDTVADRRGMPSCKICIILKSYINMELSARTPDMADLWQEQDEQIAGPAGGRPVTPDMDDLWDADPQRKLNKQSNYFMQIHS